MELRIVLAMLGGAALGMAALIILIAAGLDLKECYFLAEFWRSLKAGEYDYEDEEEDEPHPSASQTPSPEGKAQDSGANEHGPTVLDPVTHEYVTLTDEDERSEEHED